MAWRKTCSVTERMMFVARWAEQKENFAALCRAFGVSRKTGYKWVERFEMGGPTALEDRATTPSWHPRQTPLEVVDRLVLARKQFPYWGPKKLRAWLEGKEPNVDWPAPSTIGEILKKNGLIRPRKRRLRVPLNPNPLDPCDGPNDVWCADYKGHFLLGDGSRCHPLTITDGCSRYLLKCEAMHTENEQQARECFELAFREFGLPKKIRTDNGQPFASVGLGGLSPLAVYWIKLGIELERIDPGKPQQNGQHERMHRTLKEQLKPVGYNLQEQQRALDRFRCEFNEERPHEALQMQTPKSRYALSMRVFPASLSSPEYPGNMQTRMVQETGVIGWSGHKIYLASFLKGEPVGLRETDEDVWDLFYGSTFLGQIDGTGKTPVLKRATRLSRPETGGAKADSDAAHLGE